MPLYDYECPSCGAVKEVSHPVAEIGKIRVQCDVCREPMKKLLSIPALIGFDDVGRSIGRKERESGSESKKDGSKPDGKGTKNPVSKEKAA